MQKWLAAGEVQLLHSRLLEKGQAISGGLLVQNERSLGCVEAKTAFFVASPREVVVDRKRYQLLPGSEPEGRTRKCSDQCKGVYQKLN